MAHLHGHKLEIIDVDGKKIARSCPSNACLKAELQVLRLRAKELSLKLDTLTVRLQEVAADESTLATFLRELGEVV